ncbi:MAG: RHS repeat protein, partial [Anaerolineales bacterium]|nr:RHS repeat protein [Anaerolineales bacterium]
MDELQGNCGNYWGYSCDAGETAWSSYAQTNYTYDLMGNLETVTDAAGNVTTMTYDAIGRKIGMDDPDMGIWAYEYDALGNLTRQADANGDVLCFAYDDLNRLTAKAIDSTPASACPADLPTTGSDHLATYVYDTAANGKGQLHTVSWGPTPAANSDTFSYDGLGRMFKQVREIDNRVYAMETTSFDPLHRPLTVLYPDGETVTMTYDREGENSLTAGSTPLVSGLTYNAQRQLRKLDRTSVADTIYSYYSATGTGGNSNFRLQRIQHGGLNTDNRPDFTYEYDLVGNVTHIEAVTNNYGTDVQTFAYDHLNRLDTAIATGGVADYNHNYNYDKVGNITQWIEGSTTHAYSYSGTHPHAVTSVTNMGTYGYDDNGNMITRTDASDEFAQLFDVENRLTHVVNLAQADFSDTFDFQNDNEWNFDPTDQTVPHNLAGDNVVRNIGSSVDYSASMGRKTYNLGNGNAVRFRFRLTGTNTYAHFYLQTPGTYGVDADRFGLLARNSGFEVEQRIDDNNAQYVSLLDTMTANTWYVLTMIVDDENGFVMQVYEEGAPENSGVYHSGMLTAGESWQFLHTLKYDTAYLDDYAEMPMTSFAYDAGGQRTKTVEPDGTTIYYPFPNFEEEVRLDGHLWHFDEGSGSGVGIYDSVGIL